MSTQESQSGLFQLEDLEETISRVLARRTVKILSYFLLLSGLVALILQAALTSRASYFLLATVGTGIWAGIVFIITGSLGIWATTHPSGRRVVILAVTSLLAILISIIYLVLSSLEVISLDHKNARNFAEVVYSQIGVSIIILVFVLVIGILACVPLCSEPAKKHSGSYQFTINEPDVSSNDRQANSAYDDPGDFDPIKWENRERTVPGNNVKNHRDENYNPYKIYVLPSSSRSIFKMHVPK